MTIWPVLLLAGIQILGLGMIFASHGKPKEGNTNGWAGLLAFLLSNALLYWGGWFNPLFPAQ